MIRKRGFDTTGLLIAGVLFLFLLPQQVLPQQGLSLSDCLRRAFEHSHLLKFREINLKVADEKLLEARAQTLPTVQMTGLYTRIGKITEIRVPAGPGGELRSFRFGTPNRMNLDIKLQLPVFTWGRISSSLELSRFGKDLAELEKQQEALNLTEQVLRGYFSFLLNQEVVRIQQRNVERSRHHLETAQNRYQAGVVPKLDVLRAEVQLKSARAALKEAQANLLKSRLFLGKLLGLEAEAVQISGKLHYEPVVIDEQELIDKALNRRIDLRQLGFRRQMAQSQIALANSGNKPNVFLFSGYNVQNGFDPMNPERFVDNWNVGVQVVVPLFDGFATKHKVAQSKLELNATQLQSKEIEELVELQIRQAVVTLRQAEQKITVQEENIKLSREALKSAETQYQNGLIASIQVVDARQALVQSELLFTQAIFNHTMAKLEICRATSDFAWFESSLETR